MALAGWPTSTSPVSIPLMKQLDQTGGSRSNQGCACSSWPASCSRVRSAPKRPANITPTGNPSGLQYKGTDIAGWPVMLYSTVNTELRVRSEEHTSELQSRENLV